MYISIWSYHICMMISQSLIVLPGTPVNHGKAGILGFFLGRPTGGAGRLTIGQIAWSLWLAGRPCCANFGSNWLQWRSFYGRIHIALHCRVLWNIFVAHRGLLGTLSRFPLLVASFKHLRRFWQAFPCCGATCQRPVTMNLFGACLGW